MAELTLQRNFKEIDGVVHDTNPDGTMTNLLIIRDIPGDVMSDPELVSEAAGVIVSDTVNHRRFNWWWIIAGSILVCVVIAALIIRRKIKHKTPEEAPINVDQVGSETE